MDVIIIGAPGSGKGTQAEIMIKNHQFAHLSTGDMLRAAIATQTEVGLQAKEYLDRGELVPDTIVMELVRERVDKEPRGLLFDGFPRNQTQAIGLDDLLKGLKRRIDKVVYLVVPREELFERLAGRGRKDDQQEIIENRLTVYLEQTKPLVDYYRQLQKLCEVDGVGSVEAIAERIESVLTGQT